jgi:alpha-amylase
MGEVFNGDPAYVGPYQGHVTGVFNYPMYYTIKDVFGGQKSMYGIKNRFNEEGSHFSDIDALGLFVDNHDNARFLHQYSDKQMFKNALTFALTSRGIPFYYYGSEQEFSGGNDPQNREALWGNMNTNSDIYKMTAAINKARKATSSFDHPQEEKYVTDNFYAFSRGEMFVALTNTHNQVEYTVPNMPWADGTTVCNIFNSGECQSISGKSLKVTLQNG